MKYAIALALALSFNATADLMIKFGMRKFSAGGVTMEDGAVPLTLALVTNVVLVAGVLCFALNVPFYAYALSGIRISVAYPIMFGGGFTIIALVAWRFLGETLSAYQWAGVGLIFLGLCLVAREMNATAAT